VINRRAIAFWLVLALCAGTVLGAMTWLTRGVLAAERERLTAQRDRAAAEARADLEERTRLALWRMDAQGAAIMLRENLEPVEQYQPGSKAGVFPATPEVLLHFQVDANQTPVSPEAAVPDTAAAAGERLRRLRDLLAAHPLPGGATDEVKERQTTTYANPPAGDVAQAQAYNNFQRLNVPADQLRQDADFQGYGNLVERSQRARAVENTVLPNKAMNQTAAMRDAAPATAPAKPAGGASGGAYGGALADAEQRRMPAAESASMVQKRAPAAQPAAPVGQRRTEAEPQALRPAPSSPPPAAAPALMADRKDGAAAREKVLETPAQPPAVRMVQVPVPVRDEVEPYRPVWLGGELLLVRKVTTWEWPHFEGSADLLGRTTVLQGVWLDALRPAWASWIITAAFERLRTEARIGFSAASVASL